MAKETPNSDNHGAVRRRYERFTERLRDDAGLRARVESGDAEGALRALGVETPPGVDLRVAVDTDEVFHIAFPPDPNANLRDEELIPAAVDVDSSQPRRSGLDRPGKADAEGSTSTAASISVCTGMLGGMRHASGRHLP